MKKLILGFLAGSIVTAVAAPFNMQITQRADLAVTSEVRVVKLADGGVGYYPTLAVPQEQTLPDGGTQTVISSLSAGPCEVTNATVRTNVLSFMNTQGLMCGRITGNLEQ